MPAKPSLRAVEADERAKPVTIGAAAELSERALLVALRDKLADELDKGAPAHTIPRLAAQLLDVDSRIRLLDKAGDKEDSVIAVTDDEVWDQSAI